MDKRFGAESILGFGGGIVSEASQKATEKAADLCRRRRPNEAVPYLMEAIKDPNNLDAYIELAFISPDPVDVLEVAALKGRKLLLNILGPTAFADTGPYVGKFWDIAPARPYMRILQAQVRLYVEIKQAYKKAAATAIEMLRLCPGDNMGQRSWLGALLLHSSRPADALYFSQIWIDNFTARTPENAIPARGGTDFKAPRNGVIPSARDGSDWMPAVHLYDSALAAFMLYGADSEEAREYLRLAAAANPHIITKILVGAPKPSSQNHAPRQPNGPEDAQDYRWLAHELWTASAVLNWVKECMKAGEPASSKSLSDIVLKRCGNPACNEQEAQVQEFKRCAGCHLISYCGSECQKTDWRRHKQACKEREQIKQARKGLMKGKGNVTDMPVFTLDLAGGVPVVYDGEKRKAMPMPFPSS
ncbi:MYND-type domain-containing protein [Mycena indigotica]|uniref:phytol kinase n=1 Tax=Mycena indigotica TaxID=2126181 RepID=A0A8H6VZ00_9AGAR|nr:MYND-type domain-containing protein [Mycena indigotica]KAF7297031.1 MYND-type domain-containing protein [Mycena indigotica]